jgi:hypothetical protein
MINGKPTQKQLDDCNEVLNWIKNFTEITEPYATDYIKKVEDIIIETSWDINTYDDHLGAA